MVLEDHPVIKNHLDENSDIEISHSNEDKMKIHLDKIKQTLPLIKEKHLQISLWDMFGSKNKCFILCVPYSKAPSQL